MPIYEYKCQDCASVVERVQRITDAPLTTCDRCGGRLERLISRSAFLLKGSGWYKDLYSSPKAQGGEKEKSTAAASSSQGEAAPAAAAEKPRSNASEGGHQASGGAGSSARRAGAPRD